MNERVLVLRDAVVKITQMLSGQGVKVTQRGVSAYVTCDEKGRPNCVNLPYLPDNSPDDLCFAIQGFLDHEVAHILFSDFTLLEKAEKAGIKAMLNMLEDARIEKCMAQRFSGCGHNLAVTGEFFLNKFTEPMLKKAMSQGDANKVIGILMVPLIRAMSGQHTFKEYMKDKMHLIKDVYDRIADLEAEIQNLASSEECFELALEIKRRIRKPESESKGEGESKSESTSKGKSEKSKGNSSVTAEKEDDSEPSADGDSDSSDADETESESEESGEGGSSGGEDESSDSDESSDGGDPSDSEGDHDEEIRDSMDLTPSAIEEAIDKENANGYDENMSAMISASAASAAEDAPYLVFTKEDDVIEPLHIGAGYDSRMLTELADKVDHMVGPLQKDLERAIAARSLTTWEAGKRSGRLHSANLSRLAVGDGRVFRRRHESTSKDVAVELVIDASGSMSGSKIHLATQSAYALSSVLERIGIQHEVICFTTGPQIKGVEAESRKIGRSFSRTESLYMPVIKSFAERLSTQTRQRFGWLPNSHILRNNVDGECVEIAARRLMARREKGKVMIVLSDGWPSANGDTLAMSKHLKNVVKNVEKAGVNVVGIGIEDDSVRRFYPKHLVINNVAELPDRVVRELRHLLIH